jgi:bacterial leucyl aminopeptidase
MKTIMLVLINVFILKFALQAQSNIRNENVIDEFCAEIKADSIKTTVQNLQAFGTRYAGASNRKQVSEWIRQKFIAVGCSNAVLDSFYLSYLGNWQYNVVATITGSLKPDSIYIVGGHHDSYAYGSHISDPGADDNATGTAAAIEVARIMIKKGYRPQSTIKFITFAAEELGLYGSESYATRARNSNMRIQMMINNDVIGYCTDSANYWKVNLKYYSNSPLVTALASQMILQHTTLDTNPSTEYLEGSDSWSFYEQNYKTVYLEEYQETPYIHSLSDVWTYCNFRYTAEVTKISCAMLISENGTTVVNADENTKPLNEFALYSNYPNPFNPSTTIRYQVAGNSNVSLKIYNILGQEVRTLVKAAQTSGEHTIQWDGKDHTGAVVSSGIYIYRLQADHFVKSDKMMLIR